jgi:hypothetical protein
MNYEMEDVIKEFYLQLQPKEQNHISYPFIKKKVRQISSDGFFE